METINGIQHYRWATGKILAEKDDAVVFYKDYGDTVQVTDWRGVPKVNDLKKLLNPLQAENFQINHAYECCGKINFHPSALSFHKIQLHRGQYLSKNKFFFMLEEVQSGINYLSELGKGAYKPELKYAVITTQVSTQVDTQEKGASNELEN